MTDRLPVVFDANVLVGAVAAGASDFESWPSPPPTSGNAFADCLGIANDAREFSLYLSEHVLTVTAHVLTDAEHGFGWDLEHTREYMEILIEIAQASGGAVLWEEHDPTQLNRQGNDVGTQYRSAIYTSSDEQLALVEASRAAFQAALTAAHKGEIATEIAPLTTFYYAEDYHQQYLDKDPNGYCGLAGTGVSCPVGVGISTN